jgi:hypothetical protein
VGLDKETRQGRRGEGIGVYGGVYSINELNWTQLHERWKIEFSLIWQLNKMEEACQQY